MSVRDGFSLVPTSAVQFFFPRFFFGASSWTSGVTERGGVLGSSGIICRVEVSGICSRDSSDSVSSSLSKSDSMTGVGDFASLYLPSFFLTQ